MAPGRVNLIGEHQDYCGLPVLPAALSNVVAVAWRARDDGRVRLRNRDRRHLGVEFGVGGAREFSGVERWGAYPGAAVRALGEGGLVPAGGVRGFDGVVASDLPEAAGLSSSSALTVASALAALGAAGLVEVGGAALEPGFARRLADVLAAAERGGAGTRGGSMDQSVSLGAVEGAALHIAFDPPAWTPVPVSAERFRFLVAGSGTKAEKGGAAREAFNARAAGTAAALGAANRVLGGAGAGSDGQSSYADLVARHPLPDLLRVADQLPSPLAGRFRHVVTEARRTRQAVRALRDGDARALGAILDEGHESLRRDFEVSTPDLDALTGAARASGALGARLTGAGFGGSAVVLATPETVRSVREGLIRRYYEPRGFADAAEGMILDGAPSGPAALLSAPVEPREQTTGGN